MRSDNERALLAFLCAAAASLEGVEVIEQASLEGDHAANGLAEVGVREVKAQTRVLKSHLEKRLKRQLDWSERLATWLVRHSANCLSRYRIQNDGKTPDQRRTGKRWRCEAVEFGERKQHSHRSPHVVKVEWQVMRREGWMEFSLVITSAPAHRCSFQSVDC